MHFCGMQLFNHLSTVIDKCIIYIETCQKLIIILKSIEQAKSVFVWVNIVLHLCQINSILIYLLSQHGRYTHSHSNPQKKTYWPGVEPYARDHHSKCQCQVTRGPSSQTDYLLVGKENNPIYNQVNTRHKTDVESDKRKFISSMKYTQ